MVVSCRPCRGTVWEVLPVPATQKTWLRKLPASAELKK